MQLQKERRQLDLDRLRREHRALDDRIRDLQCRAWLNADEESEVKRLKRLKLHMKDAIATLAVSQRIASS